MVSVFRGRSGVSCRTVRCMSDSHAQALAAAVRKARTENGYPTQKSLATAMGVNPKTIQNLENASRSAYAEKTLLGLDDALGWNPGSATALLRHGTPPESAGEAGGPRRFARIARARMNELGITADSALAKDVGLTEAVLQELSAGRLPDEMDPAGIEAALQWEPGDFPRVLIGYTPRLLPPDIAGSAECGATAGASESMEAARRISDAFSAAATFTFEPLETLDTRSRMFAVAWLLGSQIPDFDLLSGRQYQLVLGTVRATFEAEVSRLQMADPRYSTEPTPSGFTRAEIDEEMARGGDATEAIRRLSTRQDVETQAITRPSPAPPAVRVVPQLSATVHRLPAAPPDEDDEDEPDWTAFAARTNPHHDQEIAERTGWREDLGEETQVPPEEE